MKVPAFPKYFRELTQRTADVREAEVTDITSSKRHRVQFLSTRHEVIAMKEDEGEDYELGDIVLVGAPQASRNQIGGPWLIVGRARHIRRLAIE